MKTFANLIVLTSMFISQFSGPYTPQSIAAKNTPTAAATRAPAATATSSGGQSQKLRPYHYRLSHN